MGKFLIITLLWQVFVAVIVVSIYLLYRVYFTCLVTIDGGNV